MQSQTHMKAVLNRQSFGWEHLYVGYLEGRYTNPQNE